MNKKLCMTLLASAALFAPAVLEARGVNINTASAEALVVLLDGVTPQQARAIVAWRKRHGEFQRPQDLLRISGMPANLLARNLDRIRVSSSRPDPAVEPD